ncbi:spore germination protein [Haloplasma contractile]|uniref:Spore germination protein n=1 Tax=Haloplasma contractile SSD-17B TaxID=1033810 RepID=F7PZM2_9MOLU|nr:spore germination protein [Haloplasma contractile]ERJ13293.1 spore germination protein [Haloplasma contractile SSD-17B]
MSRKKNKTYKTNKLGLNLVDNVNLVKKILLDDDTLITRYFNNQNNNNMKFCILFIDGLISNEIINENIIKPLIHNEYLDQHYSLLDTLKNQVILSNQVEINENKDMVLQSIMSGDTVLFADGHKEALIINTKYLQTRAIEEPVSEKIISGPREGFTESLTTNLSLIRKRIQTTSLRYKFRTLGKNTQTKICICYIEGIANNKILDELNKRLDSLELYNLIETNYISEVIKDAPYSPFKTTGSTERPDIVAAKLLEGRIALLVNGTPVAMTVPHLFIENMQSNEDYYINYYFSTIGRILRIVGFFTTISIPAIYLALISYHQEVIPTELIVSIFAARQAIPFPTVIELLALLFVFEILREAGTRMPTHIGQALSIVGALVLGQAAVEARFVSAPMVIVVGFSGITSLMIPKLTGASITIRTFLIFLTSLMGLYGYFFGVSALLIHLFKIRTFGVPYMDKITPNNLSDLQDTAIRAPWWYMQKKHKNYLKNTK